MPPDIPTPARDLGQLAASAGERLAARIQAVDCAAGDRHGAELAIHAALDECLAELTASGCWGEANRLPSSRLWTAAGPWLQHGWLQNRARSKPRGYAGDYQLLEAICRGRTCDHPLGQIFDRYFQAQQAPGAVRNRCEIVAREIRDAVGRPGSAAVHVASIGSGPAWEIRSALTRIGLAQAQRLRVCLVDLDPEALEFAQRELALQLEDHQIRVLRENLLRLHRGGGAGDRLDGSDVIACTGLFDYLSDEDAGGMLRFFWDRLARGGRMLVFNFCLPNTSRAYMEWIGNWYLRYRDRQQMESLAQRAGIPPSSLRVDQEPSGCSLYWQATKE